MVFNFTSLKNVAGYFALLFSFTFFFSGGLTAQVKFTTVVSPEKAAINDYIQVKYIIENARSVEDFSAPVFKGLELRQGPSQSTQMSIINGSVSRSQTITYLLQAQAGGKYTIPGAIAIIDGKTMRSNPVTIEIDAHPNPGASARPTPQRQRRSIIPVFPDLPEFRPNIGEDYRLMPGEDPQEKIDRNLFVKLSINKTTCYTGEPILATYKLYSRLSSETHVSKSPTLNGFSVYDMKFPREVTREEIEGRAYNVQIIRKVQLLPLQAGSYTVDPVEMESRIDFIRIPENNAYRRPRSSNPMQQLIDDFFGRNEAEGMLETHTVSLKSQPVAIKVLPLPDNKPANFFGAVGKFSMSADLKKKDLKAGDVAELDITIEGKGNIPMITAPRLSLPSGMEAFEPAVTDQVNNSVYPLSGSKKVAYTFLVGKEGDYTLSPVSFSYFDPAAKAYKTLHSDTFSIHVAANSALVPQAAAGENNPSASPAPSKWTDIIGIEMIVGTIIILILLGVIVYLLKKNQAKATPVMKEEKASEDAEEERGDSPFTDPLEAARKALVEGNQEEFYSQINKAIRDAIHRKTGIDTAILTKNNMSFILREKEVSEDTVQALESLMSKCEMALYTPVQQERDKVVVLEKAESVIGNLEKSSRGEEALIS